MYVLPEPRNEAERLDFFRRIADILNGDMVFASIQLGTRVIRVRYCYVRPCEECEEGMEVFFFGPDKDGLIWRGKISDIKVQGLGGVFWYKFESNSNDQRSVLLYED